MGEVNIIKVGDLLTRVELQPTVWFGEVPLFDLLGSERLLGICKSLRIGVIGIEGFTLSGENLYPDMDYIADFSVLLSHDDFEVKSLGSARKFLELAEGGHILFEYMLATQTTR
jgi:hypothetical protein